MHQTRAKIQPLLQVKMAVQVSLTIRSEHLRISVPSHQKQLHGTFHAYSLMLISVIQIQVNIPIMPMEAYLPRMLLHNLHLRMHLSVALLLVLVVLWMFMAVQVDQSYLH